MTDSLKHGQRLEKHDGPAATEQVLTQGSGLANLSLDQIRKLAPGTTAQDNSHLPAFDVLKAPAGANLTKESQCLGPDTAHERKPQTSFMPEITIGKKPG